MIALPLLREPITNGADLPTLVVYQRDDNAVIFDIANPHTEPLDTVCELQAVGGRELFVHERENDGDGDFVVAARRRYAWRIYVRRGTMAALIVGDGYLRLPIPYCDDDPLPSWHDLAREFLH